jgi:hypothetical protein
MDRADPDKPLGKEAQGDEPIFCPKCASELRLMINILDTRKGKTVRLFRCECGEFVWGD